MAAELELIVHSAPSSGGRDHGRLKATLWLNGQAYWYGEHGDGLDWTWIDLLEFLGRNWSALMLEQGYPIPLDDIPHPGQLLQKAQARWDDMGEEPAFAEEEQVLRFLDRHNLSVAMSGANLPMLLWLRSGDTLWLVDEDEQARRVAFHSLQAQLEAMGDVLAREFEGSAQAHVRATVHQWRRREEQLRQDYLAYTTGLDDKRLTALQALFPLGEAANDAGLQREPVYLAAARMVRHHLSIEQIAGIMRRLREAPKTGKHPLGELLDGASACLRQSIDRPPFEQGYQLARWLREQLGQREREAFDPEGLLRREGVSIEECELETPRIDAIACWGDIDPLILLNRHAQARAATDNGRRSTLAHELCHLLIDRTRALPVAEVLGGEVDSESEKRANAFAAELLVPQAHAIQVLRQAPDLKSAVAALTQSHRVSRQLVAYQLLNAPGGGLSEEEKVILRNYTAPS